MRSDGVAQTADIGRIHMSTLSEIIDLLVLATKESYIVHFSVTGFALVALMIYRINRT